MNTGSNFERGSNGVLRSSERWRSGTFSLRPICMDLGLQMDIDVLDDRSKGGSLTYRLGVGSRTEYINTDVSG